MNIQSSSFEQTATAPPAFTQASLVKSIERARLGDQSAFQCLFEYYYKPVYTYLSHLINNKDTGHDLAQETFLRAWKGLPKVQGEVLFRPWLYRIATNVARSYIQHERLTGWLSWFADLRNFREITSEEPEPEALFENQEVIAEILSMLPRQSRSCLLLQHVAGFSQREIADILHISEKSVSAYVSRGREQFRRAYRQMEEGVLLS